MVRRVADSNSQTKEPSKRRLLIVDDEVRIKQALCDTLTGHGYETEGYTTASEAITALHARDFDVLITDMHMSQMDGMALLREALTLDAHLVVIMMTGYGTIDKAVEAMKLGAFDFVQKPLKMKDLLPVLTRACQLRNLRKENLQLREYLGIYEVSQAVSTTLDTGTILETVMDGAIRQFGFDEASILLPTPDGTGLRVAAARGRREADILNLTISLGEGIAGWVAGNKELVVLEGPVDDARFSPLTPRPDINQAVSAPLLVGGQCVGVLNLSTTKPTRSFTPGQRKALSILTSTAAPALKTATLVEQLQLANEEWEQSVNALHEHVCILDQDGRILRVNKVAQDQFAPVYGKLIGLDHREVYFAGADPDFSRVCDPTFHTGKPVVLDTALPSLPGWYQVSCLPLTDREQKLWGAVLVVRNLTLQRTAEETLRTFNTELEERVRARTSELASRTNEFELVVRSLPDTVLRIKEDGRVVFSKISPEVGISGIEGMSSGINRFEPWPAPHERPGDCAACIIVDKALEIGLKSRAEGGTAIAEIEVSGEVLELRVTPLSLGDYLVLVRNISARHKLEVELSNALKQEKELSELKAHFFSVASHEFRTPLTAVSGSVDLLQNFHDRLSESKRIELLDRIATGSNRLTSIMDDILTLSRIEAGKIEVKKETTELTAFLSDIIDEAKFVDKNQHRLKLTGSFAPATVNTDPKLLRHIVSNLITNAMRYSPEGSLVELAFGATESGFWFEVQDEGIGIPPKDQPHLFEPFFRASNAGNISGTGLGLNIVRKYTDLLGGKISVLPIDRGARFRAEFPGTRSDS
jgi:signal transduction histidine kinase/FixJ family two-component response regulator